MTIPEKMADPQHDTPRARGLTRWIENAMALCLGGDTVDGLDAGDGGLDTDGLVAQFQMLTH